MLEFHYSNKKFHITTYIAIYSSKQIPYNVTFGCSGLGKSKWIIYFAVRSAIGGAEISFNYGLSMVAFGDGGFNQIYLLPQFLVWLVLVTIYYGVNCQLQIIVDNWYEPVNMELSMDMKTLAILFIYCTSGVWYLTRISRFLKPWSYFILWWWSETLPRLPPNFKKPL